MTAHLVTCTYRTINGLYAAFGFRRLLDLNVDLANFHYLICLMCCDAMISCSCAARGPLETLERSPSFGLRSLRGPRWGTTIDQSLRPQRGPTKVCPLRLSSRALEPAFGLALPGHTY